MPPQEIVSKRVGIQEMNAGKKRRSVDMDADGYREKGGGIQRIVQRGQRCEEWSRGMYGINMQKHFNFNETTCKRSTGSKKRGNT